VPKLKGFAMQNQRLDSERTDQAKWAHYDVFFAVFDETAARISSVASDAPSGPRDRAFTNLRILKKIPSYFKTEMVDVMALSLLSESFGDWSISIDPSPLS
jgi:hypothetical protein